MRVTSVSFIPDCPRLAPEGKKIDLRGVFAHCKKIGILSKLPRNGSLILSLDGKTIQLFKNGKIGLCHSREMESDESFFLIANFIKEKIVSEFLQEDEKDGGKKLY